MLVVSRKILVKDVDGFWDGRGRSGGLGGLLSLWLGKYRGLAASECGLVGGLNRYRSMYEEQCGHCRSVIRELIEKIWREDW
jgi:hypothetical protein